MAGLEHAILVGVGGALGALLRVFVTYRVGGHDYPFGTLAVNVLGSFVIGLVAFSGAGNEAVLFVGTGVCGSFTTFSSFSFETVRLWETGDRRRAIGHALGNLVGATLALGVSWVFADVLIG